MNDGQRKEQWLREAVLPAGASFAASARTFAALSGCDFSGVLSSAAD